jgi:quercetin dioxygenase-like cupin family protein
MTTPFRRPAGDGRHLWFLADLMTVKATRRDTGDALALIEGVFPPGDATPPHIHHTDDEAWYVLEGVVRLSCGDEVYEAEVGDFLFAPKGIEHRLEVTSEEPARLWSSLFRGTSWSSSRRWEPRPPGSRSLRPGSRTSIPSSGSSPATASRSPDHLRTDPGRSRACCRRVC